MSDGRDSAADIEAAFYAAFQNGDLDAMAMIWERSDSVVCIHPQGPRLSGYERVIQSWEQILRDTDGFRITIELLHHYSDGDLSVRVVSETVSNDSTSADPVVLLATNAYRRTDAGWRIILHHASPSPKKTSGIGDRRTPRRDSDVTLH